ncbi:MAG: hypothetical protein RSD13_02630 [Clostridium sp.]|uniref:hypothetical protein n=1 Tax=Clostridium sp. TaxID=1506 RepID=UPI002FCA3ACB
MKYIIFLILAAAVAFLVMSYEGKLYALKKQLLIANNHVDRLRKQVPKYNSYASGKKLDILFSVPTSSMGIINEKSNVFISPIPSSQLINITDIKMEVKILDKATINNDDWYYISLPLDTTINCRGWVNKTSFSYFYGDSTTVTNKN